MKKYNIYIKKTKTSNNLEINNTVFYYFYRTLLRYDQDPILTRSDLAENNRTTLFSGF